MTRGRPLWRQPFGWGRVRSAWMVLSGQANAYRLTEPGEVADAVLDQDPWTVKPPRRALRVDAGDVRWHTRDGAGAAGKR